MDVAREEESLQELKTRNAVVLVPELEFLGERELWYS